MTASSKLSKKTVLCFKAYTAQTSIFYWKIKVFRSQPPICQWPKLNRKVPVMISCPFFASCSGCSPSLCTSCGKEHCQPNCHAAQRRQHAQTPQVSKDFKTFCTNDNDLFIFNCCSCRLLENGLTCAHLCATADCYCIVLQPGISLPHGVGCRQEGHQAGQGKPVCYANAALGWIWLTLNQQTYILQMPLTTLTLNGSDLLMLCWSRATWAVLGQREGSKPTAYQRVFQLFNHLGINECICTDNKREPTK